MKYRKKEMKLFKEHKSGIQKEGKDPTTEGKISRKLI